MDLFFKTAGFSGKVLVFRCVNCSTHFHSAQLSVKYYSIAYNLLIAVIYKKLFCILVCTYLLYSFITFSFCFFGYLSYLFNCYSGKPAYLFHACIIFYHCFYHLNDSFLFSKLDSTLFSFI